MSACNDALNEWDRQQQEMLRKLGEKVEREGPTPTIFGGHHCGAWPKKSYALGVHPSQINEEVAAARAQGIDIDFVREGPNAGDAILPSRAMRKKYSRAKKLHDKDGGYGDA